MAATPGNATLTVTPLTPIALVFSPNGAHDVKIVQIVPAAGNQAAQTFSILLGTDGGFHAPAKPGRYAYSVNAQLSDASADFSFQLKVS